jgi:poly-gamma-glutamate capsule biosynthesis protein CapA/YwtB (metallophosphatase superfamily)
MATEPEAKGSDARPGPLTPAARRRSPVREPDGAAPPEPAWNLSDELLGLETGADHVDAYAYGEAPPVPRTPRPARPRPSLPQPPLPAPPARAPVRLPRAVERHAPAAISIGLVGLAVLLQAASVVSSFGSSGAGSLDAGPAMAAVAPGGRLAFEGEGAEAGAELVLETRTPQGAWHQAGLAQADEEGGFRVEGRVAAGPGQVAARVRAVGGGATTPVAVTVRPLRLASVGDINLGDVPGDAIAAEGPRYPWESAGRALRRADIAFGNLESAVSRRGEPFPKQYNFRGTPAALAGLRRHSGIDVLNLANNHVGDYGPTALLDTVRNVERLGMRAVGAGPGLGRALQPQVVERLGLRVAFVGFSNILPFEFAAEQGRPGVAWATPEAVAEAVRTARRSADVVVATFHWGIEKAPYETAEQAELARIAAGAGAQLVIGAHPHVLQPLRRTGSALVAYSLGNFVFGAHSPETAATGVLHTDLSAEGVTAARWRPGEIAGGRPVLAKGRPERLPVADPDAMAIGLTLGG